MVQIDCLRLRKLATSAPLSEGLNTSDITILQAPKLLAELLVQALKQHDPTWSVIIRDRLCETERTRVIISVALTGSLHTMFKIPALVREQSRHSSLIVLHEPELSTAAASMLEAIHPYSKWIPLASSRGGMLRAIGSMLPGQSGRRGKLTRCEQDVLTHLREGKPNKMIAYDLSCSESTVKIHLGNVMRKLGARNRTQLALVVRNFTTENYQ